MQWCCSCWFLLKCQSLKEFGGGTSGVVNVEEIAVGDKFNWMLKDSMKIQVSACAGTAQVAKRLKMLEEEKKSCWGKVVKETISFHNVKSGKNIFERYRKIFLAMMVE